MSLRNVSEDEDEWATLRHGDEHDTAVADVPTSDLIGVAAVADTFRSLRKRYEVVLDTFLRSR